MRKILILGAGYTGMAAATGLVGRLKHRDDTHITIVNPQLRFTERLRLHQTASGQTLADQCTRLEATWNDYDFFFLHYKYTDSTGEDGNFPAKVQMIEKLDEVVPDILKLKPDVFVVTGDHSTPSFLKAHSWHPVPTLLVSDCCRPDGSTTFGENTAIRGSKSRTSGVSAGCARAGTYGGLDTTMSI